MLRLIGGREKQKRIGKRERRSAIIGKVQSSVDVGKELCALLWQICYCTRCRDTKVIMILYDGVLLC